MIHTGENVVDGIPVVVVRKRIRRINLRVTTDGVVRLSIPSYWATLHEGESFLRKKLAWVRKVRADMRMRPQEACVPVDEAEIVALRQAVDELSALWSARFGEVGVCWKLRKVKTFWGCCNWRKRLITYNVDLARAPRELVEYVVVHELTHLQVHDHGPKFCAFMDARLPDWQNLRRRLNKRAWVGGGCGPMDSLGPIGGRQKSEGGCEGLRGDPCRVPPPRYNF